MHLKQTTKDSQFYRFHSKSDVASEIFSSKNPSINGKDIIVLQVAINEIDQNYNMIIEFIYKCKNEKL